MEISCKFPKVKKNFKKKLKKLKKSITVGNWGNAVVIQRGKGALVT